MENLEDNQLLKRQLQEAKDISIFLDSPTWHWLRARLEAVRPRLMLYATSPEKKRDDRMIAMGKLALVEEILSRPTALADLARRYEASLNILPEPTHEARGGGFASPGML